MSKDLYHKLHLISSFLCLLLKLSWFGEVSCSIRLNLLLIFEATGSVGFGRSLSKLNDTLSSRSLGASHNAQGRHWSLLFEISRIVKFGSLKSLLGMETSWLSWRKISSRTGAVKCSSSTFGSSTILFCDRFRNLKDYWTLRNLFGI